jgi:septal ring factor EnvC (AmiA/AmiB activator)
LPPNNDQMVVPWNNIVDIMGDLIKTVDENSKREMDNLRTDICLLRSELNDSRSDNALLRNEMNTLRVDMADMRGQLQRDMLERDNVQSTEIALIKQQGKIEGDKKAKFVAAIVFVATTIVGIIGKVLGIV